MALAVVNRKELAAVLGCSLPTVNALVERYADFPVIERGNLSREWQFDADAVVSFLGVKKEEQEQAEAARSEVLAQLVLPIGRKDDTGKPVSLDDEISAVKLRRLLREEEKETGFLVPTHEVRDALAKAFRGLNANLDSAVRRVGRVHNLPDPIVRAIEAEFANARQAFVRDAGQYLSAITPLDDDEFALRA